MTARKDNVRVDRRLAMALAAGAAALAVRPRSGQAQQGRVAKPKLPAGRPANGVPVALLGAGVDYSRADIASRLLRDGEGEAVAWDAIDNDLLPFERAAEAGRPAPPAAAGTELALILLAEAPGASLIPVRIPGAELLGLASGLMFTARTPAAVVVALGAGSTADPNGPLPSFARASPHALVIVPAGGPAASPQATASSGLGNLIRVTACDSEGRIAEGLAAAASSADVAVPAAAGDAARLAHEATVRLAALGVRLVAAGERIPGAELKRRILAHARPLPAGASSRTAAGWIADAARIGTGTR